MDLSPEALVARLAVQHEDQIRRIIKRRSGPQVLSRTTVDDLYQETVAAAIAGADRFEYRDDARFIAWISRIAQGAISRQLAGLKNKVGVASMRRDDSSAPGVFVSQIVSEGTTPSGAVSAIEASRILARAIKALPRDYRRVIVLYKLKERSLEEVAAAMGRSKVAICCLVARALSLLREKLEDP